MSDATCKTCPWWVQVSDYDREHERGWCHRYAPRPVENVTDDFPAIYGDDWCGEHPDRKVTP